MTCGDSTRAWRYRDVFYSVQKNKLGKYSWGTNAMVGQLKKSQIRPDHIRSTAEVPPVVIPANTVYEKYGLSTPPLRVGHQRWTANFSSSMGSGGGKCDPPRDWTWGTWGYLGGLLMGDPRKNIECLPTIDDPKHILHLTSCNC
jgi:hypothetical protein